MVPGSSPQNTVMRPWARRPKACLLLNDLSLVQIMLHFWIMNLINVLVWSGQTRLSWTSPDPVWSGVDTPELNPPWSWHPAGPVSSVHLSLVLQKTCWAQQSEADGSMTSSGSDLLDPTCNRVLPHAFPSRLSLTSLLHYSLLLPLLPSLLFKPLHWRRVFLPSEGSALGLRVRV